MENKKTKLNVLLAKTDSLAASFKAGLKDYIKFFKGSQGAFKGMHKTYSPREGTIDEPSMRGVIMVQTTVDEKLDWLEETQKEYIDALFSQEKTNASGVAKAHLKVDEVDFGELTTLELLRLKTILESSELKDMYETIPVRSDSEVWNKTTHEEYLGREIYESKLTVGVKKSTTKESYILQDPNLDKLKDSEGYKPQIATKDTIIELGDYTAQAFTGEYSHRERAEILRRRDRLLVAVISAIKEANDCEVVESELTAEKLFGYLHNRSK